MTPTDVTLYGKSPIDVKATRIAERINRLDPEYLARWRRTYETARADYMHGDLNAVAFVDRLQRLGFRSDALRAEIIDADRDINNPAAQKPRRSFRYELKQ